MVYDFSIRKPWNRNVVAMTSRDLAGMWRRPDEIRRMAPLLPAMEVALRLPRLLSERLISLLPRTHRMWVWRTDASERNGGGDQ